MNILERGKKYAIFEITLYSFLAKQYATNINHFALVKLTLLALDKTIFYFLIFAVLRLIWLLLVRRRRSIRSEASVWVFFFLHNLSFDADNF